MPAFEVVDQDGVIVRSEDFIGKDRKTIVYFYHKDNTSGCTAEACSFRDNYAALTEAGYNVVGVSKDSVSTSVFPMMAITEGHFADFVPIPRELFLKATDILNTSSIDYTKRKRRILYLMRDYHYTDDEPWGLTKPSADFC